MSKRPLIGLCFLSARRRLDVPKSEESDFGQSVKKLCGFVRDAILKIELLAMGDAGLEPRYELLRRYERAVIDF